MSIFIHISKMETLSQPLIDLTEKKCLVILIQKISDVKKHNSLLGMSANV